MPPKSPLFYKKRLKWGAFSVLCQVPTSHFWKGQHCIPWKHIWSIFLFRPSLPRSRSCAPALPTVNSWTCYFRGLCSSRRSFRDSIFSSMFNLSFGRWIFCWGKNNKILLLSIFWTFRLSSTRSRSMSTSTTSKSSKPPSRRCLWTKLSLWIGWWRASFRTTSSSFRYQIVPCGLWSRGY